MYIKKVTVNGFRNFNNARLDLNEGLNALIGANNTGKSNFIKVIEFLNKTPNFTIEDFNKNVFKEQYNNYKEEPPIIKINYEIEHIIDFSKPDSAFEKLEKFLLYKENGGLEEDGELAKLTASIELRYYLNPIVLGEYKSKMQDITTFEMFYDRLSEFVESFQINYYNVETGEIIDSKYVNSIFEIETIEAERHTAKISDVSKSFVRGEIEKVNTNELKNNISESIQNEFQTITDSINTQIKKDQEEIGITNGNNEFISSFGFDGDFVDNFKYVLKNVEGGYYLPVSYNGLGYNNLIYISNKIKQKKDNDYNVLIIEEPEAHLHPNMQYQLIKYIENLKSIDNKGIQNQIIVTSHSPNISSSTDFEHMILCDYVKDAENIKDVKTLRFSDCFVYELSKQYLNLEKEAEETPLIYNNFLCEVKSNLEQYKKHLEKFLDVTRSDLLFSSKIILVEGISEKLTIPLFAELLAINLIDKHIVIEEVGGITFNNFFPIFLNQSKKAVCFTDCDYKYIKNEGETNKLNDFNNYSDFVAEKEAKFLNREFKNNDYFKFYTQSKLGSTFETELLMENYEDNKVFNYLVDLMELPGSNQDIEPNEKISYYIKEKSIKKLNDNIQEISHPKTREKVAGILKLFYNGYERETDIITKEKIEKVFFVYLLYSYIKKQKGDFALKIASDRNIKTRPINKNDEIETDIYLKVPTYIEEGLKWLLA